MPVDAPAAPADNDEDLARVADEQLEQRQVSERERHAIECDQRHQGVRPGSTEIAEVVIMTCRPMSAQQAVQDEEPGRPPPWDHPGSGPLEVT